MKTSILFLCFSLFMCTALAQQDLFIKPLMLHTKITLNTALDTAPAASLTNLANATIHSNNNLYTLHDRLNVQAIDYRSLPAVYDVNTDILPSIHEAHGLPFFRFNELSVFEGTYRISNTAFFEANKNSILGQAYDNFCPSSTF